MTTIKGEVIRPDRLYVYCGTDGITRMRCGKHVHHEAWGKPMRLWAIWPVGRRICPECAYKLADARSQEVALGVAEE